MSILSGLNTSFFGLDIGTSAVRVVQLNGSGTVKQLARYAYVPVDGKTVQSDAKTDQQKLLKIIQELLAQAQITEKNVAVGIPSARVFTTVIDFDRLPMGEMKKAIQYQADSFIPTPLAQSKLDWAVIGDSPKEPGKVEVLLSSVDNEYVEKQLDLLESIGLNIVALEPDNLALARALMVPDSTAPQMILDIGTRASDIVIMMGNAPRLTRSIPTGIDTIIKTAAQNLNVDDKQAEQFIFKFGLNKDKLEGRVYNAVIGTVDLLASDIEKSIQFFKGRYNQNVSRIIVTGAASTVPEFPVYIANKFGIEVEIGNAWRNVSFAPERQAELLSVSNHFGVAAGLAERV